MGRSVIVYNDIDTFTIKTSIVVFYYINEPMESAFFPFTIHYWSVVTWYFFPFTIHYWSVVTWYTE